MEDLTERQQYISRLDESGWLNNPACPTGEQRKEIGVTEEKSREFGGCRFNVRSDPDNRINPEF